MLRLFLSVIFLFSCSNAWAAINDLPGAPDSPDTVIEGVQPLAVSVGPYTFGSSDPTMANRLNRDANASLCDPPKAFPGTLGGGPYRYKTFTLYNNGPGTCITVLFDVGDCDTNSHLAAYLGSFNPDDLSENYLGDVGSSVTQPFSFNAPVGSTVVILAHQNYEMSDCSASFSSDQLSESLNPVSIPSVNSVGMGILALILATFVFFRMRSEA